MDKENKQTNDEICISVYTNTKQERDMQTNNRDK